MTSVEFYSSRFGKVKFSNWWKIIDVFIKISWLNLTLNENLLTL